MVAMRAADTWLNQVIADHGSTQSDETVLVERTQAQLAADSSLSPGTVAAYLRRLDDEGLVVSRRPLRFRVEVPQPSRSRRHVSTEPTCNADVLSLLAGLLTDPDALANPWAAHVAKAVALLADTSRLVRNRVEDRGTASTGRGTASDIAVPRSLVVELKDKTETSASSLSRSPNRGPASVSADPRHSDESVATWVAQLQRLCDSRRDLTPPGNLTRLIAVFQRHSPEQVERALSKVSLDVEARKITSPVGVLVTAGESAPSSPAHLEYFGSAAADPHALPTEHRPVAFEEVTNPDGTTAIRVLS